MPADIPDSCSRCGAQSVKAVPRGPVETAVDARIECMKCHKLHGYIKLNRPKVTIDVPVVAVAERVEAVEPVEVVESHSPRWLYVSKRLDIVDVPNEPPWNPPVFTMGQPPVPYYRLTPAVFVWIEAAGAVLERAVLDGKEPRTSIDSFLSHMEPIWLFANLHLDISAVRAARDQPIGLPVAPDGPR